MDHQDELRKLYDSWAGKYDSDAEHNIAIIKIHPVIMELLGKERRKEIGLDLGCGTGILTVEASESAKEIVGVDYSEGMLSEARKKKSKGAKVSFLKADVTKKLPFDNNSFDFVISVLMLHHLKEINGLYKEIFRILKPGGAFIFDEFIMGPLTQEQVDNPFKVNYQDPLTDAKIEGVEIWNVREIDEHKELLSDAGLKVEEMVDVYCDEKIEPYIINYEYHKGRVVAKVFLARKNNG